MTSVPEEYLASVPESQRQALERLHSAVVAAVPDAEQAVRRGLPAYLHRGKQLASIGSARDHVSLYVMYGDVLRTYAAELAPYDTSSTVVRFDPAEPIPTALVTRLIEAGAREIDGDAP
jgi:uncharacterized protein YdhG (YjbR/CyaY superfamily)